MCNCVEYLKMKKIYSYKVELTGLTLKFTSLKKQTSKLTILNKNYFLGNRKTKLMAKRDSSINKTSQIGPHEGMKVE